MSDTLKPYDFLLLDDDDQLADPFSLVTGPSWDSTSSVDSLNFEPDIAADHDDIFVDPQPDFSFDSTLFVIWLDSVRPL